MYFKHLSWICLSLSRSCAWRHETFSWIICLHLSRNVWTLHSPGEDWYNVPACNRKALWLSLKKTVLKMNDMFAHLGNIRCWDVAPGIMKYLYGFRMPLIPSEHLILVLSPNGASWERENLLYTVRPAELLYSRSMDCLLTWHGVWILAGCCRNLEGIRGSLHWEPWCTANVCAWHEK